MGKDPVLGVVSYRVTDGSTFLVQSHPWFIRPWSHPLSFLLHQEQEAEEEDFDFDGDKDDDFLFEDEKYLKGRRDSKSTKPKYARRPRDRRNSSSNPEMEELAQQHTVDGFHVTEVKPKKQSSTSSDEVDIDAELASLVKDMKIKPKESEVVELPKNVLYFGWFLGPTTSESLTKLSEASLKECLEVTQFLRWIDAAGDHGVEKGGRGESCV